MQITLTDEQYARLRSRSDETGVPIAELIRRELDRPTGRFSLQERLDAVRASAGMCREDAGETGAQFVERMRPGLDERMRRRGL